MMTTTEVAEFVFTKDSQDVSHAYVEGILDDSAYDAYMFVWSTSADRGETFKAFMELPIETRARKCITAIQERIGLPPHLFND